MDQAEVIQNEWFILHTPGINRTVDVLVQYSGQPPSSINTALTRLVAADNGHKS